MIVKSAIPKPSKTNHKRTQSTQRGSISSNSSGERHGEQRKPVRTAGKNDEVNFMNICWGFSPTWSDQIEPPRGITFSELYKFDVNLCLAHCWTNTQLTLGAMRTLFLALPHCSNELIQLFGSMKHQCDFPWGIFDGISILMIYFGWILNFNFAKKIIFHKIQFSLICFNSEVPLFVSGAKISSKTFYFCHRTIFICPKSMPDFKPKWSSAWCNIFIMRLSRINHHSSMHPNIWSILILFWTMTYK